MSVRRQKEGGPLLPGEDILHTLAEVSIAFAGFSGVVGVFGGGSRLSSAERTFRVRALIVASLAAVFAALIPLALDQFGFSGATVWGVSSVMFAAYVALALVMVLRTTRALRRGYSQPRFSVLLHVVSGIVVLSLLAGALGLLPPHAVYISAILYQLALGSIHFVMLVVASSPRSAV